MATVQFSGWHSSVVFFYVIWHGLGFVSEHNFYVKSEVRVWSTSSGLIILLWVCLLGLG